jgi:hypothetical protein
MKYAYIESNIAREVVQTNPANLFQPAYAALFISVPDEVKQGWIKSGSTYSAPPVAVAVAVVPTSVTMRQARLALLSAGLLSSVDMAITSLADPAKSEAQIEWEYAQTVDRNAGLVPAMASALGMTEIQIDDLFILAATL